MTNPPPSTYSRLRPWLILAIAWIVAFDVAWAWQRASGAHENEIGGHAHEAKHYLTGLMLRDYVASSHRGSPRGFAGNYISHYPDIDLRLSPPFFHAVEAGWMLAAGTSRISVIMLMAAMAATGATLVFLALRTEYGLGLAALGGLVTLCLPVMREAYVILMPEMLAAALVLGAALLWGQYLDRERPLSAVGFGFLTGLALLTDLSGWALLLQVPLSAVVTGKSKVLARPATWGSVVLAMLVAGPIGWYLSQRGMGKSGALWPVWSWTSMRDASLFYPGKLGFALGIILLVFFAYGILRKLKHGAEASGRWNTIGATLGLALAVRIAWPDRMEALHLVPLVPMVVMFVIAGLDALTRRSTPTTEAGVSNVGWKVVFVSGLFAIAGIVAAQWLAGWSFRAHFNGYSEAAKQIMDSPIPNARRVLVSSDAIGEGALTAELAMREARPGHTIKRANTDLVRADRVRGGQRPRFETSEDLAAWFPRSGIAMVALDQSIAEEDRSEAHDQLVHATEDHPEIFWPVGRVSITREGRETPGELIVFRVKTPGN